MDYKTFEVKRSLSYPGEGWGLTYDGDQLIMSNGSDNLYYRDPETFKLTRKIAVTDHGIAKLQLNELEYAAGFIWANAWFENILLKIDPTNGKVVGKVDLTELAKINITDPSSTVLNGIAYDPRKDAFWITGKYWPKMYLIKITI